MKKNEILPLGTIVTLRGSYKKLFIIGVNQKPINEDKVYDYCACLHPFGYLNSNDIFLFNHEKIFLKVDIVQTRQKFD